MQEISITLQFHYNKLKCSAMYFTNKNSKWWLNITKYLGEVYLAEIVKNLN